MDFFGKHRLKKERDDLAQMLGQAQAQVALLTEENQWLRNHETIASTLGKNKNEPLISIVVTSYNYCRFLKENLDSLLNQTWTHWEALVVDDGSQDGSKELILDYASRDSRIKYIEHENHQNKGLVESLQLGLRHAQGELIAFCESDDYWHPMALEFQQRQLVQHPEAALCFCSFELIGEPELFHQYQVYREFVRKNIPVERRQVPQDLAQLLKSCNPIFSFSCVMVRTQALKACLFESPVPAYLDWWLWRQIAFQSPIIFNDLPLTYWRAHTMSFCQKEGTERDKKDYFRHQADALLKETK